MQGYKRTVLLPMRDGIANGQIHLLGFTNSLRTAISMRHNGVVKRLLAYPSPQCQTMVQNPRMRSISDWAMRLGQVEIVNLLTQKAACV
jgi:hypothetical protein